MMPDAADGTISREGERFVIRFERRFPSPIEEVWAALTRPERLTQWVGATEVELELVDGGKMVTRTTGPQELVDAIIAEAGPEALETRDTVLRVEPPRVFEHTFGGAPDSVVRWELEPVGGGCLLRLAHTEPAGFEPKHGPRDLAGWHELLELLALALQEPARQQWSAERWESHRSRYAERFGADD